MFVHTMYCNQRLKDWKYYVKYVKIGHIDCTLFTEFTSAANGIDEEEIH